jgi:hypothetical protein
VKTPLDWSDPEIRRDALIVGSLFVLGLLAELVLGLTIVFVLELLGLWDVLVAPISLCAAQHVAASGEPPALGSF